MVLKETVFGSKSEEKVYNHLKSIWGDKIRIYHNLPFANIFDIDSINLQNYPLEIGLGKKFLLMTSVDFVVCDEKNRPIMCIEFDGMTGSYNKGTEVFQESIDRKRKGKLEFKLKIARNHALPFYIISYEETRDLSNIFNEFDVDVLNLTVVDGIIGQTMKHKFLKEKIDDKLESYGDYIESLNDSEGHEIIQDLVFEAELELDFEWDPIAIKTAKLQGLLYKKGIISRMGWKYINKPELPDIEGLQDTKGIEKRIEAFEKVEWVGCEVWCETPDGKMVREAWIRNFDKTNASPLIIVQNIADLLIFSELAKQYGIKIP